jgi:glycosyltransferase involved in cell wall biosynthesis
LITEKYPPVVGGGESHIAALADGLADHGDAVTVLTEAPHWLDGRSRPNGRIAFREVPGLIRACESGDFGDALRSLRDALASVERVDVVHVFNRIPAALCGMIRSFLGGPICLSTFETVMSGQRVFGLWNDFDLELEFARNVAALLAPDAMICGSNLYRQWALAEGYRSDAIHVIPFGTDACRFHPDERRREDHRARRGWTGRFIVLVPARPIPRKRIEDVIAALPAVLDVVPEAHLVLTNPTRRGNDDYVARLRASIEDRGLADHVTWLPGLAVDDMPDLMRAADIAVLPADDDGFGIVLIEAMASGVPVVASDVPGHDEAVTDDTGTLYPPRDTRRLTEAIVRVARAPDRRRVDAARERVRSEFSTQQMVARHLAVYHELLRSTDRATTAER